MKRARSGPPFSSSRRSLLLVPLAALLLVPGVAGAKTSGGEKKADAPTAASLARRNADYRRLLDLASSDDFYLLLDPERRALRFQYKGNVLYEFAVARIQIGSRRGWWGRGSPPAGWADSVWTAGRLDPPRKSRLVELDTSSETYEKQREATLIPPTPEEAYPAPPTWRVRYRGGLVLEFTSENGGDSAHRGPFRAFGRWLGGLFRRGDRDGERLRLRITLTGKDADTFYRAIPDSTRFALSRWP
jgi:hypothetical protein